MAIERRVTELAGRVGGKLHTARSRNDQVATDVAMFVRAHAYRAVEQCEQMAQTLVDQAQAHLDWPMPGYTHLQRAQPVYLSHHLLAYCWMLIRDRDRFAAVVSAATGALPAGCGRPGRGQLRHRPGAGRSRARLRRGGANSIDAVSNRDFVLDYLAAAATCATHLSRLGGEVVLWSSEEFGFCEVADAWASGSSIMPQKKNPDAAELLRAKAPRVAGHLVALHGVLHGLPLDLQQGHAGGQGAPVRRRRHDRAVPRGGRRHALLDPLQSGEPGRGRCRRDAGRDRHRRPAGPARPAVPRGSRRGGRPGALRARSGQGAV